MKLKMIEKAICLGLVLTTLLTFTGFAAQCEDISNHVLRLHVLANSDSDADQALKLKVRDRIVKEAADIFDTTQDVKQAKAIAAEKLDSLQAAAQDEVYKQGDSYPVKVELTNMYFNTRVYSTVTLPAGNYDAVRVTIGKAAGKNWWCVIFPPMCLPAAEEKSELKDVLNQQQMDIVDGGTQQYEVKFKVVEIYEQVRDWFSHL